jgi:hypothetical protein
VAASAPLPRYRYIKETFMDSLLVCKLGNRGRKWALTRLLGGTTVLAVSALLALSPRVALAQNDDDDDPGEIDANSKPKQDANAPTTAAKPETKPEAGLPATVGNAPITAQPPPNAIESAASAGFVVDSFTEKKNGAVPQPATASVDWHGGAEIDIGQAKYTFDSPTYSPEKFYDFRGRFVMGPTLTHEFGGHYFIRARGEAVAWLRDAAGSLYQVNVDDVFGQVGDKGLWDLKAGRFFSWRVYHKGLGVDLYTLEDAGAISENDTDNPQAYGPHTYEVNAIYYRERPGKIAFHLYPTNFLGIETVAVYGRESQYNNLGGRAAAIVHFPFLRVSGAAEYRSGFPAIQALGSPDPATGARVECTHCGVTNVYGFGGGAEVTIKPVEIGLNAAQEHTKSYTVKDGTDDPKASNKITSIGGYGELDVGSLAFDRSLIAGAGWNRTEVLAESTDFTQHIQMQAYVYFPLGFNDAAIKLVGSRAQLQRLVSQGDGTFHELNSVMNSIRFRFSMGF